MGNKFDRVKTEIVQVAAKDPSIMPMTHMELFGHLIKAGPTMHGTPGDRKKRGGK